jgi:tetratricopeptide (TPR) repeat protein
VLSLSAVSWRQIGYWRDSFTLFEHATRVTRGNFTLHYNLANLYKRRGEVERAEHHYEQAVAAHPAMVRAHFNFANMLRDQGRLDEAIEHYAQAAAYSHGDLRALTQLVVTVRARDANDAASIAWLRETIEVSPERGELRVALGDLLLGGGKRDEAIEVYRAALERWPDSTEIRQRLEEAAAGTQRAP